ncbi:MAG: DUF4886 domain-containing protein [Victivallaceae bacterium]|nr:DUF4886 domain-containing protein [Victivallaceae bacterium]
MSNVTKKNCSKTAPKIDVRMLLTVGLLAASSLEAAGQELSVLMIGNSYSNSVLKYLPQLANADGNRLYLVNAYIGGCTMRTHVENIRKDGVVSDYKPYSTNICIAGEAAPKSFAANLPEIIKMRKWDIVTIQQGSHESWNFDNYQPFAGILVDFVRKSAPEAKILIHETWSYRSDSALLASWKMTNAEMFRRASDAYALLAAQYGFKIIPVGTAVELYRQNTPVAFCPVTADEKKRFVYPGLPSDAGDVVGQFYWSDNPRELRADTIHLNKRGCYLQALVWNAALFGIDPLSEKWQPADIDANEADLCRKCAALAVRR